ncbi:MAG: type II toxin-antitoxin system RelE/ParE family toxin [bacterium]|nr:type II toxin-antitoxin system RelE/ParE family toxin [bacterium]
MNLAYELIWHEGVLKDLKKLDKEVARKIVTKVKNYLIVDPLSLGKPLKGNFSGLYRYRIGDYRVIYSVNRQEVKINILAARHRKDVYKA